MSEDEDLVKKQLHVIEALAEGKKVKDTTVVNVKALVPKTDSFLYIGNRWDLLWEFVNQNIAQRYGIATNFDKECLRKRVTQLIQEKGLTLNIDAGNPLLDIRTRERFSLVFCAWERDLVLPQISQEDIDVFNDYILPEGFAKIERKDFYIGILLLALRAIQSLKDQNSRVIFKAPLEPQIVAPIFAKQYVEAMVQIKADYGEEYFFIFKNQPQANLRFISATNYKELEQLWQEEKDIPNKLAVKSYEELLESLPCLMKTKLTAADKEKIKTELTVNKQVIQVDLEDALALKEIAEITRGHMNRAYIAKEDEVGQEANSVLLKVSDIIDGKIFNETLVPNIIAEEVQERAQQDSRLKVGDLIIAVRGSNAEIAIIDEDNMTKPLFCNYHLARIRLTDPTYPPEYIYAYLKSEKGKKIFCQHENNRIFSINLNALKDFKIEKNTPAIRQQISEQVKQVRQKLAETHRTLESLKEEILNCYEQIVQTKD